MNALQLNAELHSVIDTMAEDETLLAKMLKYAKRLVAKKEDPTLMTKEEFFAMVDDSLEQARQGKVYRMRPDEKLDTFLERMRADGVLH